MSCCAPPGCARSATSYRVTSYHSTTSDMVCLPHIILAVIRRLYALGSFLGSRLKFLLFVVSRICSRKITTWLTTTRTSTCRSSYWRGFVDSQKLKSAQPSCTLDYPPLASSLGSTGPAVAASSLPASSSQLSVSRTSNSTSS